MYKCFSNERITFQFQKYTTFGIAPKLGITSILKLHLTFNKSIDIDNLDVGTTCNICAIYTYFIFFSASIISKKAAENLDALVLDVKYGKAAFMQTMKQAETLAKTMVGTSKELGIKTVALLTKMDHPIGLTVGNALEVSEALECLHGRGPNDLVELVTELGEQT